MENLIKERASAEDAVDELDEYRMSKDFLILGREEQILINRQSVVMHGLVEILNERIAFHKRTRS